MPACIQVSQASSDVPSAEKSATTGTAASVDATG